MCRILIVVSFLLSMLVSGVSAKTVKLSERIFMSVDTVCSITCNIEDTGGCGMQEGKMKFRAWYADGTFSSWTSIEKFSKSAKVTLTDIDVDKRFQIQGLFADSLSNWQLESAGPKTSELFEIDFSAPETGTVVPLPDVVININN